VVGPNGNDAKSDGYHASDGASAQELRVATLTVPVVDGRVRLYAGNCRGQMGRRCRPSLA
jgi:hypothetical protein